jgi:hypothetical protein
VFPVCTKNDALSVGRSLTRHVRHGPARHLRANDPKGSGRGAGHGDSLAPGTGVGMGGGCVKLGRAAGRLGDEVAKGNADFFLERCEGECAGNDQWPGFGQPGLAEKREAGPVAGDMRARFSGLVL